MKYILMLYKIWKSSKYNPKYHDPSYTLPANAFGVYPESYYMELIADSGSPIQKTKYYDSVNSPAVFIYDSPNGSETTDYYMKSVGVDYILEDLKGKKIEIYRKETTIITTQSTREHNQFTSSFSTLYGTYELYQPIALIGFKPDLKLVETFQDPETGVNLNDPTPTIPVFLFYYMVDYSNLKKIDFGVMLAAEIALNLTGVGALSKLRYLGYLSKARAVWAGTATTSEVVLFWEAATGLNAIVQFTAGNLLAISNYVGNTTTDPDIKEFTEKVNVLLGILTLGSLLANPAMKKKLFTAAADVLAQERKLILLGKVHGLDVDTMNAIRGLYDVDALIDLMQLKLNALPSYAGDTILTRFSTFTRDEKYDFFAFFYNMQEEAKWTKMNFQYSRVVNSTTETYTLVDIWKDEIIFLKNYRTYEFLEVYNFFKYDTRCNWLKDHIFKGHINPNGTVGGIHSNIAVTDGYAQIDEVLAMYNGGFYEARVSAIDGAGNVFPKTANGGINSMFPNSWTKEKIIEELSYAFNNKYKKPGTWNQYVAEFTSGQKCIICINGNALEIDASTVIKTFWPHF
jgi:hypothetical protein